MPSLSSIAAKQQSATQSIPEAVISAFGWMPTRLHVESVRPGFSGALVWKITVDEYLYTLKRWPRKGYFPIEPMVQLTTLAYQTGLLYVPQFKATAQGNSSILQDGYHWTASTWQAGTADVQPSQVRLQHAIEALAKLHAVWKHALPRQKAPCPTVQRAYQLLAAWSDDDLGRLRILTSQNTLYSRAYETFRQLRQPTQAKLEPWIHRKVMQQWCVGDLWSDHVLFTGDEVSGIVDYGSVRLDHPALDLARLIGSYTQGHAVLRSQALTYYRPASDELEALTVLLDEVGSVASLSNWLCWLCIETRQFADMDRVKERLTQLLHRLSPSNLRH